MTDPQSDFVAVSPAPSPAFVPPDAKYEEQHGPVVRRLPRARLLAFLQERKAGRVDYVQLWALFLAHSTSPALDAYLDKLADELLVPARGTG